MALVVVAKMVVLRAILVVRAVLAVVVEVVLVLVVTCDKSHFQQLPYMLPSGTRIFGGKTFHRRLITGFPAKAKPKYSLTSDYFRGDVGSGTGSNSCSNGTEL